MRFTEYLRDLRDLISATFLNIGSQHRSGVGIVLFLFAASLAVSGDTTFTTGAEPSAITVAQSPADIAGDSGSNPPPGSAEKPVSQNPVQTTTYTVKAGDTLWDIAISCKTTVEQIMALNNLSGEKLSIGQQLVIAGAVPPAQTRQVLQVASRSGASTGASSANSSSVVKKAAQYLNTPYVWGGSRPGGFDCSGFVSYAYNHFGIKLERVAADQAARPARCPAPRRARRAHPP